MNWSCLRRRKGLCETGFCYKHRRPVSTNSKKTNREERKQIKTKRLLQPEMRLVSSLLFVGGLQHRSVNPRVVSEVQGCRLVRLLQPEMRLMFSLLFVGGLRATRLGYCKPVANSRNYKVAGCMSKVSLVGFWLRMQHQWLQRYKDAG